MVLESATVDDSFGSADSDDAYSSNARPSAYPAHPPVVTFLGLQTGTFSEEAKNRFINLQLNVAEREFGFHPTRIEKEGLSYYNAVFYAAEAKGALYGTLAGGAVGFLMTRRQRNVGFLFRGIGNRLRVAPKWQLLASRLTNFAFITAVGRMWGITSWGVSSFNQVSKMQREDPNMRRFIAARDQWLEQRKRESRAGIPQKPLIGGRNEVRRLMEKNPSGQEEDPQSLGGPDFYEDKRPADGSGQDSAVEDSGTAAVRVRGAREAKASGRGRPRDAGPYTEQHDAEENLFFADDDSASQSQQQSRTTPTVAPPGGWKNAQRSSPGGGGSAWDKLRRGEQPTVQSSNSGDSGSTTTSAWPRRPAMKGFESKEDSFSFSNNEDRERARQEAQRQFDERVQRERQGENKDGFVTEVDHGKRR